MANVGAQVARDKAIENIVNNFIGTAEDEIGQLITSDGFTALSEQVAELRLYGRGAKWRKSIQKWEETIAYAHKAFCDNHGVSPVQDYSIRDFTHLTGIDFARHLKWAVFQGSTYAYIANR